jgi:hypothetical protein
MLCVVIVCVIMLNVVVPVSYKNKRFIETTTGVSQEGQAAETHERGSHKDGRAEPQPSRGTNVIKLFTVVIN